VRETHDLAASYDLGADFWSGFVRRFWGRRPTVIRQPFARAIASPAEVFAAMIAATDRVQTDDHDFALTIDGVRVGADVERWLPRKRDRSLERLAKRIADGVPGSTFAVFIRAFQLELGWEFWNRLRHFLTGLYTLVGVPAHRAEVDLFAGSYPRSRRGIHLDSADVFCFVIEGRKRIRLWPGSVFPDGAYWYGLGGGRKHLSRSLCLDGEPGDILYWPSSYWHVGESRGGAVSSLSLGLYPRDSLAATAARLMEGEAARELGAENFVESLPSSVEQLEAAPPRALRAFARASEHLAVALLRRRMEQVSGHAFDQIPLPPASGRRRASSIVAADPAFPIFCRSVGGTAIVAANGRSIALPRSKALRGMIDALNRGAPVSLPQRTGAVNPHQREAVRFLLFSGAVETRRARGTLEASRGR
jgi:50S ribosomal protein L16 3-hydroxylase